MATGLGFCPTCGTAKTEADQKFCASCGATLAAPPQPPAPAAAMPVAPPPPPAYVPAAPPPPPAYAPPPPPAYAPPPPYAPQQAWGGQPVAPAAPAKAAVSPTMLLIGAVVILAIVGAAFYMMNNNSYPGTLAFSPTTVNCGQTYTTTIRLPSSVKGTDQITLQDNGKTVATQTVSDARPAAAGRRFLVRQRHESGRLFDRGRSAYRAPPRRERQGPGTGVVHSRRFGEHDADGRRRNTRTGDAGRDGGAHRGAYAHRGGDSRPD